MITKKIATQLIAALFFMIPFQKRFHGFFDSLSRSLTLPLFELPDFFSRKLHLFTSDLLILVLGCLFFFFKTPWRLYFWEGPAKYLTLLFFAFLLSTATSISQTYFLQYFRLLEFSLVFLFFNSIRSLSDKIDFVLLIRRIAAIILFLSVIQCGISIYQYFAQEPIGLQMFGEKSPKTFSYFHPGNHTWILKELFGLKLDLNYLFRVSGTFLHPNILGGFLLFSILSSYYLYATSSRWQRSLLQLLMLLQFFNLYLTFSRSALIGLILSSVFWCFLQVKKMRENKKSHSSGFKQLAFLVATIVCAGGLGIGLLYPQIKGRGGVLNYNAITQGADSERIAYMKVAAGMIKEKPLFGVGYNNFQIYAHRAQPDYPQHRLFSKVHNMYLLIASEAGLIGGSFFLLFILSILRTAWKHLKNLKNENYQETAFLFSTFLGFLFIGCCDFYFLENPQGSLPFFGVAGLLSACVARSSYSSSQRLY